MSDYRKITMDGLWHNNPATVQILGLCPLLAVSGTVVNALGLGLATMAVLAGSNACVSLIRRYVTDAVRLPAFVMIIAALVTVIEMLMQAFTFELYEILGIFIPLIVTNCVVLGRADAFASKNPIGPALLDGAMMGAGFLVILLLLGGMREVIGQGTLFTNMQLLFGPAAASWEINLFGADYRGFLFAVLPPGAFIGLGLLIAGKNVIDRRLKEAEKKRLKEAPKVSRRVRTTG
ncbi:MAG: electron transport complex subunit E [Alcanivoracaceae bacterium]|nr:electron transport complex subunit E [Alcanivoracaceae bacterium]